ncbi:MAG: metallophosphoesterase [Clostridia bacterium]|nr:metallophosphoesterase [Clostridia bacterium]
MEKFKELVYYFLGRVYVPKDILENNEDMLLHISDTPVNFYSGLRLLIRRLKPKYIVHTGDMVDNIKLEIYSFKKELYKKRVKLLIDILEDSSADKIYLALGNHDDIEIVKNLSKRIIIVEKSGVFRINNVKYKISHFSKELLEEPGKYNLFGHNLSMPSKIENDIIYLNGITGINIIALKSSKVFTLPYPYGINDDRMCKPNIGL